MSDENNSKGQRPDFVAYSVQDTNNGKGIFNKVGAGWISRDGEGINVSLSATPVNGRLCLRGMREEREEAYEAERHDKKAALLKSQERGYER